nr:Uncharacterised protein [Ipomoea batatas]
MAPVGSLNQATAYESPAHSSIGTRSEPRLLPLLGSLRFHVLIHSPLGVLFTLPSRVSIGAVVWYSRLLCFGAGGGVPVGVFVPGAGCGVLVLGCPTGGVWYRGWVCAVDVLGL